MAELVHEERLEDALGVVEGVVGERQALRQHRLQRPPVDRRRKEEEERVDHKRPEVLQEEDGGVANLRAQVLEDDGVAVLQRVSERRRGSRKLRQP